MLKKLIRYVPRPIICGLRAAWILLRQRGQTHKNSEGNCVDAYGNPTLWMTYSSIDFLESYDLSDAQVFEYGSGGSTLYWKNKSKSIVSVEHYAPWFDKMQKHIDEHVQIIRQTDLSLYASEIDHYGLFDIIVVDGAERMACTLKAKEHLKEGGIIILDNAEWYPNCATVLRESGFMQIDFCGFSPLNSFTEMTSIFIKGQIRFPYREKKPHWTPIGGKPLNHFPPDDVRPHQEA